MNVSAMWKGASVALALSLFASAQTLSCQEGSSVTAGADAHIEYSDPGRGGQTILIEIYLDLNPTPVTFELLLDDKGRGVLTWPVPKTADNATVHAPDAQSVSVGIFPA